MAGEGQPKTGGRRKGSLNKRTRAVKEAAADVLEQIGDSPLKVLANLMLDDDKAIKLAAAKELAQYIYPKRRAVDMKAEVGVDVEVPVDLVELAVEAARCMRSTK